MIWQINPISICVPLIKIVVFKRQAIQVGRVVFKLISKNTH